MADKVALVTGAGSGIGRAVALALGTAGYHVVLTGRRVAELEKTRALFPNEGSMLPVACDITQPDQVEQLFAAAKQKFSRLDYLQ